MSRHKLVKTLDLDEELDDFDGIGDYDNGEERTFSNIFRVSMIS